MSSGRFSARGVEEPGVVRRSDSAVPESPAAGAWGLGATRATHEALKRTLTLWRDGRAERSGDPAQHGEVHAFDYGRLCELVEAIHFEALAPRYEWNGFDLLTHTVRVWPSGSTTPLEVEDYGGVGPVELWGLRAAIEGVAGRIEWK